MSLDLTDRSRAALRVGESQADAMGHDVMGTRHLLLGLLAAEGGVAAGALRSFGFELEEMTERVRTVRSAREEPNPGSSGPARISQPAVMALSCALQEALLLEQDLADTEHVLLGLIRVAETYHDCGFARLVGFSDRLRIRHEILRLVARPPNPADVARRIAAGSWAPSEFETYVASLLCDALERMPAEEASAVQRMAVRFSFEEEDRARPALEVEWIPGGDPGVPKLDAYAVRIPPSGSGAQRGIELRRHWVEEVSGHLGKTDGVAPSGWEGEIGPALSALWRRLHVLINDSDVLWDVIGHSISTTMIPPSRPHAARTPGTELP